MEWRWSATAFLLVIIAIIYTKESLAIKCWTCRSDADNRCADPFDNSTFFFTDCDHQKMPHIHYRPQMCRKIRQKVNGEWRYIRSCAWLSSPDKIARLGDERYCLIRSGTWDIHIEYCECWSKDGCNSALKTKLSSFLFGFVLILVPVASNLIHFLPF